MGWWGQRWRSLVRQEMWWTGRVICWPMCQAQRMRGGQTSSLGREGLGSLRKRGPLFQTVPPQFYSQTLPFIINRERSRVREEPWVVWQPEAGCPGHPGLRGGLQPHCPCPAPADSLWQCKSAGSGVRFAHLVCKLVPKMGAGWVGWPWDGNGMEKVELGVAPWDHGKGQGETWSRWAGLMEMKSRSLLDG